MLKADEKAGDNKDLDNGVSSSVVGRLCFQRSTSWSSFIVMPTLGRSHACIENNNTSFFSLAVKKIIYHDQPSLSYKALQFPPTQVTAPRCCPMSENSLQQPSSETSQLTQSVSISTSTVVS